MSFDVGFTFLNKYNKTCIETSKWANYESSKKKQKYPIGFDCLITPKSILFTQLYR